MKPQLDTDTVLTIVKQLDALAKDANRAAKEFSTDAEAARQLKAYCQGQANAFEAFSAYLQKYIEGLVTQAENQLNQ